MQSARTARASPTSVVADSSFASIGAARPPPIAPIELYAQALNFVYSALVTSRAWDATFERGPRERHGERRLATTYLSEPAVDGWNVVFGALELARVWTADHSTVASRGAVASKSAPPDASRAIAAATASGAVASHSAVAKAIER